MCSFESIDQHVIYINLHNIANMLLENLVHKPLVGCFGVQPKGHDFVGICAFFYYERSLHFFIFVHHNLIIAEVDVHEVE